MKLLLSISITIVAAVSWFLFRAGGDAAVGDRFIYSYQGESIGYSDIGKLYSSDTTEQHTGFFKRRSLQIIQVNLTCDIRKTITGIRSSSLLAAFEVMNPVLQIEQAGVPLNTSGVLQELKHPVLAELTRGSQISQLWIDTSISELSANLLKEMLSHLQFVKPIKTNQGWQVTEENTSGTFQAKYQLLKQDRSGATYKKTNLGYTKLKSSKKEERIIADHETDFRTDSAGGIKNITVFESQYVLFGADTITASGTRASFSLRWAGRAADEELAALATLRRRDEYSSKTTLSESLSEEKINRMAYRNTLRTDGWETLMLKLENATAGNDKTAEDSLVLKFRALAYLEPSVCNKMASLLKKEPVGSYRYRVLSHALAAAETKEAVNALAGVVKERSGEEDLQIDLLPVLATTSFPTEEAVDIVKAMAFDPAAGEAISSTAQLTLGGLAYHFRKQDPKQSDEITRYLLDKLTNEPDTMQKLLVLGNTGSPLIFPLMRSYIYNEALSMPLRESSVSAIRLIEGKQVADLLTVLSSDTKSGLANAAREAIRFRKENF